MNFYNEFEPFAAEWLKELIKDGLIPEGEVDTRSIVDVEPSDLKDFTQCHFFAGIGGWAYAARLAGWRDDRPMWTGSPPCQPFSVAGKQKGTDDERHLWPVWFNLVRECKPSIIFGEQVAAAIRQGWLDSLQKDLEAENYACAAAVLPASGVGALHKRDRLWIVAREVVDNTKCKGLQGYCGPSDNGRRGQNQDRPGSEGGISTYWGNDTKGSEFMGNTRSKPGERYTGGILSQETQSGRQGLKDGDFAKRHTDASEVGSMADSDDPGQLSTGGPVQQNQWDNPWGRCEAVQFKDGKVRAIPTEPEVFPLAHGIPNRVGILRGAGNAIVPQVAAEIIKAFV